MNVRRFVDTNGHPEEGVESWTADIRKRDKFWIADKLINDKETDLFIKQIDFGWLDDFFKREFKKSKVNSDNEKKLSPDRILMLKSNEDDRRNPSASYGPITELIKLYPKVLKSEAGVAGVDYKTYLFFSLVHEIIHSQSFTDVQGAKEFYGTGGFWSNLIRVLRNADLGATVIEKSGYSRVRQTKNENGIKEEGIFQRLDESVTDKLALEIMKKYCKTHPDLISSEDITTLENFFSNPKNIQEGGRAKNMSLLEQLISELSEKSGLDKPVVWNAIKRGKFGVENTNDEETLHILNETITPTLYNQLKR